MGGGHSSDSCLGLAATALWRGSSRLVARFRKGALALDVAVDAGHPRVDLVHQQPLAQPLDVVGPVGDAGGGSLDPRQAVVARIADQAGTTADFRRPDRRNAENRL